MQAVRPNFVVGATCSFCSLLLASAALASAGSEQPPAPASARTPTHTLHAAPSLPLPPPLPPARGDFPRTSTSLPPPSCRAFAALPSFSKHRNAGLTPRSLPRGPLVLLSHPHRIRSTAQVHQPGGDQRPCRGRRQRGCLRVGPLQGPALCRCVRFALTPTDPADPLLSFGSAGGNDLASAPPSRVADFVRSRGGHTVITKVLIANNGAPTSPPPLLLSPPPTCSPSAASFFTSERWY